MLVRGWRSVELQITSGASIDNQRANLEIRFWPGEGEEPLSSPNAHPSGGCRWKCQLAGAGLAAALLSIAFC